MIDLLVDGIKVTFNDLTYEKQLELYKKDKKKYKEDASKSIHSCIREMVVRDEIESPEFLNQMLINEQNYGNNKDVENAIFNNDIFEIKEETIKNFASSKCWEIRQNAAKLSKNPQFLNQMLKDEANGANNEYVKNSIFSNNAFEINEETIKYYLPPYSYENNWRQRVRIACLSKNSKFLNQMLRSEINGYDGYDGYNEECVKGAIYDNDAFEIEEETIKVLASSMDWKNRRKAAQLSKDSKFLNQMLRNEIDGDNHEYVKNSIFSNNAFIIEKETIKSYIKQVGKNDRNYEKIQEYFSEYFN